MEGRGSPHRAIPGFRNPIDRAMIRCYLPPQEWDSPTVRISGPPAHHLIRVLRVKPGDLLVCFDGRGTEAQATVRQISRKELQVQLGNHVSLPEPPWAITLGVGIPKKGRFDQIVDQSTQLGVDRIIPLSTARGVVRIPAGKADRSHDSEITSGAASSSRSHARWVRISVEAGQQCGVSRLPVIQPVTPWRTMMASLHEYDLALIGTLQGPYQGLSSLLSSQNPRTVLLLIGPEGDFTEEEIQKALQAGAHRFSLGPTVLRSETAALAAVSLISFLLRDRQGG